MEKFFSKNRERLKNCHRIKNFLLCIFVFWASGVRDKKRYAGKKWDFYAAVKMGVEFLLPFAGF